MLYKIFRVVVLVVLLVILGLLLFFKVTPQGQEMWKELSGHIDNAVYGKEAQDAAAKLIQMKVQMGTMPPDTKYVTLNCSDANVKLGDEGFRLIGKCVQLEQVS